ncbi:NADH dehydrogenase [ubiquinone] 1 alpha subcomplex assembly factor 4-like [Paramacrobiotus metropolitanus]|uniref:NADH dehydrogenase [ubiquinone] 1 alpha subcomplex assembly factor 4-like n=1 Tax=Paramacrobiotus metropolitanus TaxID=2943436 RepID=UPI00244563F0|nr:NADH dehydrogenase [ubiquinone] 1 alpha subcomplex assembly factor 4-like [Paramacrobiotus metropolitanus]
MGLRQILTRGVRRVFRNWNVENRAMRAIDRPDRAAPPRYPTEEKMISEAAKQDPTPKSQIPGLETEKNPVLDDWLKKVKVYSKDVPLSPSFDGPVERDPRQHNPQKPLPQERAPPEENEFGTARYNSNLPLPPGKLTLKSALQLLSSHQQEPSEWTVPELSRQFNISEADVADLIRYFGIFAIHVPQKDEEPKVVDMKSYFNINKSLEYIVPLKLSQEKRTTSRARIVPVPRHS